MRAAFPLLLALAALGAGRADASCRLALLLALDVSASVDKDEDRLQRLGLARALVMPDVEAAFLAFEGRHVALSVFEWSGRYQQDVLLGWTEIRDSASLAAAAATIAASDRGHDDMPTALGYAIGHAAGRFRDGPDCDQRKLDVSGDGRNNEGFSPELAYKEFPLDGVTVNGLAISAGDDGMADYYRRALIRGPGAFVIEANDFEDFEDAMREKLLRELEAPVIGMIGPGGAG